MSASLLREAAALMREDCPIPEASRGLDFIDYPAAWALQKERTTAHDARCSATQTGGALLCDCDALIAPWTNWRTLLAVADWLDDEAEWIEAGSTPEGNPAETVARAYLGGDR